MRPDRRVKPFYSGGAAEPLHSGMRSEHLYQLLQPETADPAARLFRAVHHAMVAAGVAIMLADTVAPWRHAHRHLLDAGFQAVCAFFFAEYWLRLAAAAGAPGATHRGSWRPRLAWAMSVGGIVDLVGALPGVLDLAFTPRYASLFGFVWVFKLVRYTPGLVGLRRVISHARHALLAVLLVFGIILLMAASLAYLLERNVQPELFGSVPQALWWAIVTMSTTGYGDVIPMTIAGRLLSGFVMVAGVLVFALWAGILATGFTEETRRREFLRTWDLVAKVPFFHDIGAAVIAEVAHLLRPQDYPAGAVIMRRGDPGDCMYFIAAGEVEIRLGAAPVRLGPGAFFGEVALLTGDPRNATVVATRRSTLLALDIVHFRGLLARQPDLARIIGEAAGRRSGAPAAGPAERAAAAVAPHPMA
jgi:voltage-gated potassium channel